MGLEQPLLINDLGEGGPIITSSTVSITSKNRRRRRKKKDSRCCAATRDWYSSKSRWQKFVIASLSVFAFVLMSLTTEIFIGRIIGEYLMNSADISIDEVYIDPPGTSSYTHPSFSSRASSFEADLGGHVSSRVSITSPFKATATPVVVQLYVPASSVTPATAHDPPASSPFPFDDSSLLIKVGEVLMPPLTLEAGAKPVIKLPFAAALSNEGAFADHALLMLERESIDLYVKARLDVTVTVIPGLWVQSFLGLSLESKISMGGMRGFMDTAVVDWYDLPANAYPDRPIRDKTGVVIQATGSTTIDQKCIVHIPLGAVTADMYIYEEGEGERGDLRAEGRGRGSARGARSGGAGGEGGEGVGKDDEFRLRLATVTLEPIMLEPGKLRFKTQGIIHPSQEAADRAESMLSKFVNAQPAAVLIKGRSVAALDTRQPEGQEGGQVRLGPSWQQAIVSRMSLSLMVQGPALDLDVVESLSIDEIGIKFMPVTKQPLVSCDVQTVIKPPFAFPMKVMAIRLSMDVLALSSGGEAEAVLQKIQRLAERDDQNEGRGVTVRASTAPGVAAHVDVPWVDVESEFGDAAVHVQLGELTLQVVDQGAFNFLVELMIDEAYITLRARATASVRVDSAMGILQVNDIPLPIISAPVQGLHHLAESVVTMEDPHSAEGVSAQRLNLGMQLYVGIQAPLMVELGRAVVDFNYVSPKYGELRLGSATIEDCRLNYKTAKTTPIAVEAYVRKTSATSPALLEFIPRFLESEEDIVMAMQGRPDSTDIPILQQVMSKLHLNLNFKPPAYTLIRKVRVKVRVSRILSAKGITAYITAFNPLPQMISIPAMDMTVCDTEGNPLYTMQITKKDPPIYLPGGGVSEVKLAAPASGLHWEVLKDAIGVLRDKTILAQVRGVLSFTVEPAFKLENMDYAPSMQIPCDVEIQFT